MQSEWKSVMPQLVDLAGKLTLESPGRLKVRGLLSDLARVYEVHGPEAAVAFVVGKRGDEAYDKVPEDLNVLAQVVGLVAGLPTRSEGRYVLAKLEAIRNYFCEEGSRHGGSSVQAV